jgi:hypothetical protein
MEDQARDMAASNKNDQEITLGLYLLQRIRELGCKTVQGLPGAIPVPDIPNPKLNLV